MIVQEILKTQEDQILLSAILKKSGEFLIAHPETKVTTKQMQKFLAMKKNLAKGYPLAYLLKEKWFFNHKFYVGESVLIPRPETEILVQDAIEINKSSSVNKIIDVGTGSGAIIISVALADKKQTKQKFFAIDISEKALKIARKNARILRANGIRFLHGSLLKPMEKILKDSSKLLIVANLPYISKKELSEPSIKFEPKLALYGGKKHSAKITALLKQIKVLRIKKSAILLEINYDQAAEIKNLAKKLWPDSKIETKKDLSGYYREIEIFLP